LNAQDFQCDLEPLQIRDSKGLSKEDVHKRIAHRADVNAAHFQVQVAEHLKAVQEKGDSPKIGLFGEVGTFGTQAFGIANSATGAVGFQITIPLIDSGLTNGRVREENSRLEQATLQEKQIQAEAETQSQIALMQYEDAIKGIELANRHYDLAKKELRFSQTRFSHGATSGLELANSTANLSMASEVFAQAQTAFELARLNVFRSAGAIYDYFEGEERK
jgi:outer membrane protein